MKVAYVVKSSSLEEVSSVPEGPRPWLPSDWQCSGQVVGPKFASWFTVPTVAFIARRENPIAGFHVSMSLETSMHSR